jgi:predicted TIM-barrel fold metal-dependent hydrolase
MTPDLEIVDAHHHIWRQADLPWLSGPMVPRIFGPSEPIRRDYPVDEYVTEATACGIGASVYVQTNWPLDRTEDEVRWLQEVHAATGWPTAVICSADLFSPGAAEVMRRQASPLVRGVRLQLHWHERPEFRFASGPSRMNDPVLRRNMAVLSELGWLFELQVFAEQMVDAADFVAAFPGTTFVLVHAGMLIDPADRAALAAWKRGLRLLADQANVVVKLTGQGTFVHRVDEALIDLVTTECLALFGSRRCMWGSNFPIEKLWTDLPALVSTWRRVLDRHPLEIRQDVLARTARRVYGLD